MERLRNIYRKLPFIPGIYHNARLRVLRARFESSRAYWENGYAEGVSHDLELGGTEAKINAI
ncbi:MAG: hypothetical protein P8Z71_01970 [Candidatus Sulfobium sp.]